jgi:hypothetical protein
MRQQIALIASAIAFFVLAPVAWTQAPPDTNPALAPTKNPSHPTSGESLEAHAQELTKEINQAKSDGRDTSVASKEQTEGERSMQQGKEQDALRHFQAGERALNTKESPQSGIQ